ncbi:MAG: hypothetical protein ACYTDT_07480 [Planctomycetota bacterium]|jgi:thiol:disulfide interchange protein
MNRFTLMAGIAMLSCVAAPSLFAQDSKEAPAEPKAAEVKETEGVAWTQDYEAGLKEAKEAGKLVFLEFTATW